MTRVAFARVPRRGERMKGLKREETSAQETGLALSVARTSLPRNRCVSAARRQSLAVVAFPCPAGHLEMCALETGRALAAVPTSLHPRCHASAATHPSRRSVAGSVNSAEDLASVVRTWAAASTWAAWVARWVAKVAMCALVTGHALAVGRTSLPLRCHASAARPPNPRVVLITAVRALLEAFPWAAVGAVVMAAAWEARCVADLLRWAAAKAEISALVTGRALAAAPTSLRPRCLASVVRHPNQAGAAVDSVAVLAAAVSAAAGVLAMCVLGTGLALAAVPTSSRPRCRASGARRPSLRAAEVAAVAVAEAATFSLSVAVAVLAEDERA